jgi:branched-chain amino acid transport system substrate-binding protein
MKPRDRSILVFLIVFLIIIGGWFVYHTMFKSIPVRMGYIGSQSGKLAAMGTSARNGAILAVEKINREGGINGRPLELIMLDDESIPSNSLAAAKELKKNDVTIIVGPLTSAAATQMIPYINSNAILTVGPVVSGSGLAGTDDFFIKLYTSSDTIGTKLAELTFKYSRTNPVVVCDMQNREYCESMLEGFTNVYSQKGMKIAGLCLFNSYNQYSFSDLAENILSNDPDCVFFIASALDTALLVQHVKQRKRDVMLLTSSWALSRDLIENGGKAVEGMFYYVPYDISSVSKAYSDFILDYDKRFGPGTSYASMFNYEAIMLLEHCIRTCGSYAAEDIKKTMLEGNPYQGLQGEYRINPTGDAERYLYLNIISNASFTRFGE